MPTIETVIQLMDAQQFDDAYQACLQILQQEALNVDAVYLLAMIAREKGCQQETIAYLQDELARHPDSAILYNSIGELYSSLQDFDSAEHYFKKALAFKPPFVEIVQHNLGKLYLSLADFEQAIDMLTRAVKKGEQFVDAWFTLASAHEVTGNYIAAIEALKKAVSLNPDFAEAYNQLGNLYRKMNDVEHAHEYYRLAVEKNPEHFGMWNNLGLVQRDLGDFPAAEQSLHRAIGIKPDYVEAYQNLVKINPAPEYAERLQALLDAANLSDDEAISSYFSLGDVFDKQGNVEAAFKSYESANKRHRDMINYNSEDHAQFVNRLINTFDSEFIKSYARHGSDSSRPVFIVGMPRSGTTLLEQILSSHSQVCGAGELGFIPSLVSQLDQAVQDYSFPASLEYIDHQNITAYAREYLEYINRYANGEQYVVDKLPENYLYLGLIKVLFPRAKIFHCMRNKLDTALSIYFNFFTHGNLYAYDMKEIAERYRAYEKIMHHWSSLMFDDLFEIQYEDIVTKPETTSQALLDFLGLDWEPACLEFYKNKRAVMTNSSVQVRSPLYSHSLDRWKSYQPYIGRLLAELDQ